MEFSKRRMIPAALALGLGSVLLSGTVPGFNLSTILGDQEGKLHCTPHRTEEWQPVPGHLEEEQIRRVSDGLQTSTERVSKGKVGFAACNRPMTGQEEERGVPTRLSGSKRDCFLLNNAVSVSVEPAVQVVCTALPVKHPGRHSF